jgi:tRNA-modifying protein YgfZ
MFVFDLSSTFGRVQMTGATRLAFLHRMSTNDIESLLPGQGRRTVLTTPIGRMVDCTPVLAMDDALILLTGAGNAGKVTAWLRKYILYNDDVRVNDVTAMTQMLGVFGDGADVWACAQDTVAFNQIENASVFSSTQTSDNGLLIKAPPLQGAGFYWVGTKPPQITNHYLPITDYESLRIAAGYPTSPNEINEDYIPLEAGLWDAVSFSKGCYIGQEIIARMESRRQIAKKLVQLDVAGCKLQVGAQLFIDGVSVGTVTSASETHALGYVRSACAHINQVLLLASGEAVNVRRIIEAQK